MNLLIVIGLIEALARRLNPSRLAPQTFATRRRILQWAAETESGRIDVKRTAGHNLRATFQASMSEAIGLTSP